MPFVYGGGQERGWRAGTENTPMIIGLGRAAEEICGHLDKFSEEMQTTRDYLEQRLIVSAWMHVAKVRYSQSLVILAECFVFLAWAD